MLNIILIFFFILVNYKFIKKNIIPEVKYRHIFQIYGLWDTKPIDHKYLSLIKHNQYLNSKWSHKIYDKPFIEKEFKKVDPYYKTIYDKLSRNVAKADMARYLLAYTIGGFYLDLDVKLKTPLENVFENVNDNSKVVLIADKWSDAFDVCKPKLIKPSDKLMKITPRVCNYAFYSEPGNSFWMNVLDELCKYVEMTNYEYMNDCDVIWITGPDLLTKVYHEKTYHDVQLIGAKQTPFKGWGGNGDYMEHKIFGKWRRHGDLI
eukprot:gene14456-17085_t